MLIFSSGLIQPKTGRWQPLAAWSEDRIFTRPHCGVRDKRRRTLDHRYLKAIQVGTEQLLNDSLLCWLLVAVVGKGLRGGLCHFTNDGKTFSQRPSVSYDSCTRMVVMAMMLLVMNFSSFPHGAPPNVCYHPISRDCGTNIYTWLIPNNVYLFASLLAHVSIV